MLGMGHSVGEAGHTTAGSPVLWGVVHDSTAPVRAEVATTAGLPWSVCIHRWTRFRCPSGVAMRRADLTTGFGVTGVLRLGHWSGWWVGGWVGVR